MTRKDIIVIIVSQPLSVTVPTCLNEHLFDIVPADSDFDRRCQHAVTAGLGLPAGPLNITTDKSRVPGESLMIGAFDSAVQAVA